MTDRGSPTGMIEQATMRRWQRVWTVKDGHPGPIFIPSWVNPGDSAEQTLQKQFKYKFEDPVAHDLEHLLYTTTSRRLKQWNLHLETAER